MLFAFFIILIFIVTMDVEPPAPIAALLAVAVAVCTSSSSPLLNTHSPVMVRLPFEIGVPLLSHFPCALQTFGRAPATFSSYKVSHSVYLASPSILVLANISCLLFLEWRASSPIFFLEVSRLLSSASHFTSMPWNIVTNIFLLSFLVRRVSFPFLTYFQLA